MIRRQTKHYQVPGHCILRYTFVGIGPVRHLPTLVQTDQQTNGPQALQDHNFSSAAGHIGHIGPIRSRRLCRRGFASPSRKAVANQPAGYIPFSQPRRPYLNWDQVGDSIAFSLSFRLLSPLPGRGRGFRSVTCMASHAAIFGAKARNWPAFGNDLLLLSTGNKLRVSVDDITTTTTRTHALLPMQSAYDTCILLPRLFRPSVLYLEKTGGFNTIRSASVVDHRGKQHARGGARRTEYGVVADDTGGRWRDKRVPGEGIDDQTILCTPILRYCTGYEGKRHYRTRNDLGQIARRIMHKSRREVNIQGGASALVDPSGIGTEWPFPPLLASQSDPDTLSSSVRGVAANLASLCRHCFFFKLQDLSYFPVLEHTESGMCLFAPA
ncbi:hypothetical protein ACRALDRAFT_207719 [Sodiomyces alcalophilus JCM 7366]|uniref:uncharacterized protein n=1 Tax=Sodiomyces alcalophilus JCM 7366 TaxID=591952 RepID=UPI0039B43EF9